MSRVLLIDDNESLLDGMAEALRQDGISVTACERGKDALEVFSKKEFAVVVTDLKLPDLSGLALLREIKKRNSNTLVIMITAYGTVDVAVEAMKLGAFDFLTKPFPAEEIVIKSKKGIEQYNLRRKVRLLSSEAEYLRREVRSYFGPEKIIGESPQIVAVKKSIDRLSDSKAAVLILGETGTGKELVARAIHYNSSRRAGPFIRVNCAVFAEALLESELFGHEKGSFTGAHARKPGRFELADGGTIFLDEITELSLSAQAKLLRVLQEHEFERVGGTEVVDVDVRVIAATNRDLERLVLEEKFREDLYYRLNVVPLKMPPLRERKEDIPVLLDYFLKRYSQENHKRILGFTEEAERAVMNYHWPGNVRELENVVERGVVLSEAEWIDVSALPFYGREAPGSIDGPGLLTGKVEAYEKNLIAEALEACKGNTSKAAEMLGLSRSTLRYKIQKYSL